MMSLSLESYPMQVPGIIGQAVQDETVLLLPERGEVKVLNEVGGYIWELADGSRTIRDIAAAIHAAFEVDTAQAEADTLTFVATMVNARMLRIQAVAVPND